jgi:hypothetical protein
MRALVLATVLLVCPWGTAQAQLGLSLVEKDQARKAYNAHAELMAAWESLGTAITLATGPTARSALAGVWGNVYYLTREIGIGDLLLIGANDGPPDDSLILAREAIPRAQWVLDAWTHHDAAIAQHTTAVGTVTTARAVGGQVGGYTAALDAIEANFIAARNYLQGMNRTYSYAQARNLPYCQNAAAAANIPNHSTKIGECNVIGPHGNWIIATQQLAMAWQEVVLNVSNDNFRKVYTAADGTEPTLPDSTNPAIANVIVSFSKLLNNMMTILFNFAIIPVTPVQCGFTPFHLVSRTIERYLQFGDTTDSSTSAGNGGPIAGSPFYFTMRGDLEANLNTLAAAFGNNHPVTHSALNTVVASDLLSWRFSDGSFWSAFEMHSDLYNVIVDNAASGGPPFGTVTFPYYFPIQRGADLRVYVRNVASSQFKQPKIEGTDYTLTGIGSPTGGTVVFTTPPPSGFHVMIERVQGTRLEASRRQPYPMNDPAAGTVGPCN